jgi:hypothetical protein
MSGILKRKTESACLKHSVLIFVEKIYIKCNIWRAVVCPSCIWDAKFLKIKVEKIIMVKVRFNHYFGPLPSTAV